MNMMRNRSWVFLLFLAALPLACGPHVSEGPVSVAQAQSVPASDIPVRMVTVERHELQESIKLVGALTAERKADVASEITGRIVSIPSKEGERVQAGQVVVRLD